MWCHTEWDQKKFNIDISPFIAATCILQFTYTERYPDELPLIEILSYENIEEEDSQTLSNKMKEEVKIKKREWYEVVHECGSVSQYVYVCVCVCVCMYVGYRVGSITWLKYLSTSTYNSVKYMSKHSFKQYRQVLYKKSSSEVLENTKTGV